MTTKFKTRAEYDSLSMEPLKSGVIELMTRLGDIEDQIVVVGGFAPFLLFTNAAEPPTGTLDVDLGLSLAMLNEERYEALEGRLRAAGFTPDQNENGVTTRQRWRAGNILVDLLMAPVDANAKPGRIQNLTPTMAAIVVPGIELAHLDAVRVRLKGEALQGGSAERDVAVCGPGALVVLKALAFGSRGEEKDAHDLTYVLKAAGVEEVAKRVSTFPPSEHLDKALDTLRRDFTSADAIGPVRLAMFRSGGASDELQAESAARVRELLKKLDRV